METDEYRGNTLNTKYYARAIKMKAITGVQKEGCFL